MNVNNIYILKSNMVVFIFALILFNILALILNTSILFLAVFNIWTISFIYALNDLKKNLVYFMFLIAFFVFLVGGHFCYELLNMELPHYYSEDIYQHSNLCILISLISIFITYIFMQKFSFKRNYALSYFGPSNRIRSIGHFSKLLFYITAPVWYYSLIEVVVYVLTHSYHSYYTDYSSESHFVVRAIAAMTPYFFYLFIATLPKLEECKKSIALYMSFAVLSLLTGKRGTFVFMGLFVILYLLFRQYHEKNKNISWIKKEYIRIGLVCIPFLLVFLYLFNFYRFDKEIGQISILDMFFGFFQSQGISSSVIRLERVYENLLNSEAYYSLFGLVKYYRTNTLLRILFDPQYDFSYIHHSVDFAVLGNSLDAALSYRVLYNYLTGAGLGSCYIAELYHDGGYIAIICGSILYGIILYISCNVLHNYYKYSVWSIAVCFATVESFLKAPRWNFDIIFSYFLDLGMWTAFFIVFFIIKLIPYRCINVIKK